MWVFAFGTEADFGKHLAEAPAKDIAADAQAHVQELAMLGVEPDPAVNALANAAKTGGTHADCSLSFIVVV